jgi:hypothetical protein
LFSEEHYDFCSSLNNRNRMVRLLRIRLVEHAAQMVCMRRAILFHVQKVRDSNLCEQNVCLGSLMAFVPLLRYHGSLSGQCR